MWKTTGLTALPQLSKFPELRDFQSKQKRTQWGNQSAISTCTPELSLKYSTDSWSRWADEPSPKLHDFQHSPSLQWFSGSPTEAEVKPRSASTHCASERPTLSSHWKGKRLHKVRCVWFGAPESFTGGSWMKMAETNNAYGQKERKGTKQNTQNAAWPSWDSRNARTALCPTGPSTAPQLQYCKTQLSQFAFLWLHGLFSPFPHNSSCKTAAITIKEHSQRLWYTRSSTPNVSALPREPLAARRSRTRR